MKRLLYRSCIAVGAILLTLPVLAQPSGAVQAVHDQVVSDNPANWTPNVLDGEVSAIVQAGNTMIVGGNFSQVQAPGGPVLNRDNLFAFNANTGAISTSFNPALNSQVTALAPSADGASVYVGGFFTSVNGATIRRVTRLNISNGQRVTSFNAGNIDNRVKDLKLSQGRLYVSGQFTTIQGVDRPSLAALDPQTGDLDNSVDLGFADPRSGGALQVMKFDVSPDGSRLAAMGNFGTVAGESRPQLAVIDLTGPQASVATWHTNFYQPACASVFDSYMRDIDISPDGVYFVVTTTGAYRGAESPCDVTSRWELGSSGSNLQPTWRNYTGGDTTYAVAITGEAIYVGGHFRWQNNPFAGDSPGPGSVEREGIAALDPLNGLPLSWDPGRAKGVGVFDMLATEDGLWVGSDTDRIGWEQHGKLAFLPLVGGTEVPTAFPGSLPNDVYLAGSNQPDPNSPVLHRVNAGGPQLASLDGGPDWAGDEGSTNPVRNSGSNAAGWGSLNGGVDSTVPETTPIGVFLSERWDPSDATPLEWNFPVPAGTNIDVRLYFAAQCDCTNDPGERAFNVSIDGTPALSGYDIVVEDGYQTGTMKSFAKVSDGNVDIDFAHITENPLINGIEIVNTDIEVPPPGSGPNDQVNRRSYNGTTAGATTTLPGSGIAWSQARGGVMLNGTLYTGWVNGNLYARTFNGSTFGAARAVNLHGLTAFSSELQSTTGMFYDNGRLYFTLAGSNNLFYRYFTLESEIVGAQRYTATGSIAGLNWSSTSGMFLSGDDLYVGSSADGNLRRVDWSNGNVVPGTVAEASGPGIDGNDWRTRSMFLFSGVGAEPPNQAPTAVASGSCTGADCTFSSTGSGDTDGSIVNYEWEFGDGDTGSGPSVDHTYAAAGPHTATLTVTDDDDATDSDTVEVNVDIPNQEPTASFEVTCAALSCSFDGSGSEDPEGTDLTYAWTFGDGGTANTESPDHDYAADGQYNVELTVTDEDGGTDTTSQLINVAEESGDISVVGEDTINRNSRTFPVSVPGGTAAGDALLLFFTENRNNTVVTGPGAGWTQLGSAVVDGSSKTSAWYRVADANDAGNTVSLSTNVRTKAGASLVAYHGTNAGNPIAAWAGVPKAGNNVNHTTPTVNNPTPGAWRVSYWGVKGSAVTGFTEPGGETVRSTTVGPGGGRIGTLLTDSNSPVGSGNQGGLVAVTNVNTGVASMWTVLLSPAAG